MIPRFIFVGLFLAPVLFPQVPQPSPSQPTTPVAVVAKLNKDLNARKLKIGDKVEAQVIQDVVLNGKIAIRRDSKLVGHVTGVEAVTKSDRQSRLTLTFELGHLKKDGILNFHGVIEALGPPLPNSFLEGEMASSSPYSPGSTGHPVIGSSGQSNAPTQVIDARARSGGIRALEERQRALDNANKPGHVPSPNVSRNGALSTSSRGVLGLPGLLLSHNGETSTIISAGKNVDLKSGSQMVLSLQSVSRTTDK